MNKYQQLAQIERQIKELKNQSKQIRDELFEDLVYKDGQKLDTDYASFSITYRPKWKYSDDLTEKLELMAEKAKIMKKNEEITGKAEKISDGGTLKCQVKI